MITIPDSSDTRRIRERAEERFKNTVLPQIVDRSEAELQKLIHELDVHQIELELQNEELVAARADAQSNADKYSELYDFAPIGYCSLTNVGEIVEINLTGARLLGKERANAVKKHLGAFLAAGSKPVFRSFLETVAGRSTKESCEVVCDGIDASATILHLNGIKTDDGARCFVTMEDVTEVRRTEQQLVQLNRQYDTLVTKIPVGIYVLRSISDGTVSFEYVSPRMAEILNVRMEQILLDPQLPFRLIHPDEADLFRELNDMCFRLGTPFDWKGRLVVNDCVKWVHISSKPEIQQHGTTLWHGLMQDITSAKHAELALLESENKYRLAVMSLKEAQSISHMGNWKWDLNTGEVEWSDEMYHIFGINQDTFAGRLSDVMANVIHPDDRNIISYDNITSMAKKEPIEYRITLPDGSVRNILAMAGTVQEDDQDRSLFISGIAQDITERKLAEEALRNAQRLEGIGTLAGGIAHDFNNLLTSMIGNIFIVKGRTPSDDPSVKNLDRALKAMDRAALLTKQMLAYSGKGKIQLAAVDLVTMVAEHLAFFEASFAKNVTIISHLASTSVTVFGDPAQIEQIVMNLIINAAESLGDRNGTVEIEVSVRSMNEGDLLEYQRGDGEILKGGVYSMFRVTDTGCGMNDETKQRIFDPFFTTKFVGRGLGLSAVLGIIRGHHGGIRVQSTAGIGTTFHVVMPYHAVERPVEREREQRTGPSSRTPSVLFIDDEEYIVDLANDIFHQYQYHIIATTDPVSGLAIYQELWRSIDIVILDYSMPKLNGREVLIELRRTNPDVVVIMCSGYSEEELTHLLGNIRPTVIIPKPHTGIALIQSVDKLLEHSRKQ
ncbi:MAG: PAS domain-containing protein [Bacteroidetes bacterium]|nr:PAS domain-containing protein [Bacteroidota bacterium]